MIPFSAISQKRYKIDGDTVIIFTPKETRKLAIKLLEGEKYEKLYLTANEIQRVQDSVISFQSYHIAIRDSLLVVSFGGLDSLNSKLIDYQERYLVERKKKRRNCWIAAGSIALNAVLIFVSTTPPFNAPKQPKASPENKIPSVSSKVTIVSGQ